MKKKSLALRHGMTLVELMSVLGIFALLATLALPSIVHARRRSTSTAVANDYRKLGDAFTQYAMSHGDFPLDTPPAVLPSGMEVYMPKIDWHGTTPIGGHWDWDGPNSGFPQFRAGVSVYLPTATAESLGIIDTILDDGNLATGQFVSRQDGFTYILEP